MYKALHILLVMLFVATGAAAQRMPERAQVRKGTREYHKGNYEEAIKRYGTALTLAPGQFEATYDLGNALYKAEMYDRAEQTMMQAAADTLRSDAERAEAWYNLGNARFKQQKYQEALESYRQSLRLNPDDMEAKYNRAEAETTSRIRISRTGRTRISRDSRIRTRTRINRINPQQGEGDGQPVESGISEQEQQQILDAIQAQEDRTQEKLKEKQGVVVRGRKNW